MAKPFVIRFNPSQPQQVSWRAPQSEQQASPIQNGSLSDAALHARGQNVLLLVSGNEVLLTHAHVPSKNRSRVLSAIPFALEESLIDDVDELHFAIGEADGDEYPVAVISKRYLEDLLEQLNAVGLRPQTLLPEPLALAEAHEGWSLLVDEQRAIIRQAGLKGFSIEIEALPELLNSALDFADTEAPQRLSVYHCGEADDLNLNTLPLAIDYHRCSHPLEQLNDRLEKPAINLLQGQYRRQDPLQKLWQPWKQPLAIAALLLLTSSIGMLLQHQQLGKQEQQLRSEIEQTFRATFPNVKRVVNARAQMKTRLKKLRSGQGNLHGLLPLLVSSAQPLAQAKNIQLNGLNFRKGYLDLEVNTAQLQALDSLKRQLEQRQLRVKILSANTEKGQVKGRLRLEAGS
ncbi:MAG: type II secretion system protein GspL [Gammaproteobacteria bacterium]|nr:type II secretion system protein GspL [Gammaproteobacteria bacterium]